MKGGDNVNKIKGYRNMLSMSQLEMSKKLNISETTYRNKENGKGVFNSKEMKLFVDLLKMKGIDEKVDSIFFS